MIPGLGEQAEGARGDIDAGAAVDPDVGVGLVLKGLGKIRDELLVVNAESADKVRPDRSRLAGPKPVDDVRRAMQDAEVAI